MGRGPDCWLCDLDGVLIADGASVPGAAAFLRALASSGRTLLILTNNSMFTPDEQSARLASMGLEVDARRIWTSALATARFVETQRPKGTAFVIGERSMHEALRDVGYVVDCERPDYVVIGETQRYSFDEITRAIQLVDAGAHLIATNPEPTGPSPHGALPGCGAIAALIERATGVRPYFVGKPNPLMMREGLDSIDAHSTSAVIVGDRMETDILAGVEAGCETILVLTGVTSSDEVERFPFRPSRVVASVAALVDDL